MDIEWDVAKAASNLRKHKVAFLEATTALSDPLSVTFGDPDHSVEEDRFITIGLSDRQRVLVVSHTERETEFGSSVLVSQIAVKGKPMKKKPEKDVDELRPHYDSKLIRSGVRGKYAKKFAAGTNLVLLAPDVAAAFPDSEAVNEALRLLVRVAQKSRAHSS